VLNDDEYNGHREKIREIVNKYKTSYQSCPVVT